MTISLRTAGTWAYAASGSVTVTLPTHSAGDMLVVRIAYKSSAIATCAASTATSGWAKVGEYHNGTTNSGNGTGSVAVAAFWKIAASGSETNPTVDFSQTVTQVGREAQSYQKTLGYWVDPVGDGGPDTTAGTSLSHTIVSHVSVTSGDLVDFFHGVCDDGTLTVPTITQASVTFAAVVESPATAGTDTSGADGCYDGGYRVASSGTSSAAAVETGTLAVTESSSAAWMTRLRETNTATVVLGLLDAAPALYAPTIAIQSDYRDAIVADGPVAYWRLGEPSGTNANDEIGSNDGTYTGSPTLGATSLLTGDGDTAVTFPDGVAPGSYVSVAGLNVSTSAFSFEAWVKGAFSNGDSGVLGQWNTNGAMLYINSLTFLELDIDAEVLQYNTGGVINDGSRHHVVGTWDGTNGRLYLDGALVAGPTAMGSPVTGGTFCIGNYGGSPPTQGPFDGTIDEPAYYDYALTLTQVEDHYAVGTGGVSAQTLTVPLLTSTSALYAPTLAVGSVTLTVPLLDGASALYAPTLLGGFVGFYRARRRDTLLVSGPTLAGRGVYTTGVPQSLTVPLLDSTAALYAPSLSGLSIYEALIVADAPLGYWRLGEPSGTTAVDEMGAHDGTYVETPTLGAAGAIVDDTDTAVAFSGSVPREYVSVAGLNVSSLTVLSLEAWTKGPFTSGDAAPIGGWNASGGALLYINSSTVLEMYIDGVAAAQSSSPIADGEWHHVVGTWDGSNIRLYLDGSLVAGPTAQTSIGSGPSTVLIGQYNVGVQTPYNGTIDDAAVYDYVLTPTQVANHYAIGSGTKVVTLPLLDGAPALYAPSTSATIALGLLNAGPAVYGPTLVATNLLSLGLLDAAPALYGPTLAPKNTLTVPLLDGAPALYSPTVTPKNLLSLGLLDAAPALYAPTVVLDQFVTLGLIDGAPALYAPTVAVTIAPPLLDGGAALYAPAVIPDQFVSLDLLDGAPALYDPTLAIGGSLGLPLLDAGNFLAALSLTPGPVVILAGFLDGSPAVFAPTLTPGAATVVLGLVDGQPTLYAPTLQPTIALGLLDGNSSLYAPLITPGAVTLGLSLLDGAPGLYAPIVELAAANVEGGIAPVAFGINLIARISGHSPTPSGSAVTPKPDGEASNTKPGS